MSSDDFMTKAMEQAKELQAKLRRPWRKRQIARHPYGSSWQSADVTNEQTKAALDNLESAMKSGSEFLRKFLRGDQYDDGPRRPDPRRVDRRQCGI